MTQTEPQAAPLNYRRQSASIFIALIPVAAMAVYYYGGRVLALCGAGAGVAVITDLACRLLQRKEARDPYDFSALNTGVTLALLLPASAPYWLAGLGGFVAMAVVRHPFGGYSATLFHPANTAFAFLLICWTSLVVKYPLPRQHIPYASDPGVPLYSSPAAKLMTGGAERIDWLELLMGNFVGPMGCTCVLILLCCGIFLSLRRAIIWQIPVAVFSVVALFAWLLPRVNSSHFSSVTLELISETLIFSTIFIAALDSGEIHTGLGRWLYGIALGLIIVLFRWLSKIEMVTPFAIIILNTIDHRCDQYGRQLTSFCRKAVLGLWHGICWLGRQIARLASSLWKGLSDLLQKLVDAPKK